MAVSWIEHNGKRILYSDFRGLRDQEDMKRVFDKAVKEFCAADGKVLHIIDLTGSVVGSDFMDYVKNEGKKLPLEKTGRDAYVGITGVKNILLKAYLMVTGEQAKAFDTVEQAREWITRD